MEFIRQVLTAFCASCIFFGALFIISPDGAMKNSVKYILGLVFLITIVASTGINAENFNFELQSVSANEERFDELEVASAEYVYGAILNKNNIDFKKITVCTDKDKNGSIFINKIIIYSNFEEEEIKRVLGEVAENYKVEIINE